MYGKMVLPYLGGSPSVWTTCVLFFQSVLLVGYLYAHFGPQWLGVRRHALIHLGLLVLALVFLPIGVAESAGAPRPEQPVRWLLLALSVSMGVPFLLLSSTGPLVQAWFARTDTPSAANPYVLYAASNAGSLAALLAYPTVIEPVLTLTHQSLLWSVSYLILLALVGGLVLGGWRDWGRGSALLFDRHGETAPPPASLLLRWTVLAFIPSCMFLALTTYLATDVASVPLLWIVPLLLYLLSFMLVFFQRPPLSHAKVVRFQPLLLVPVAIFLFWGSELAAPALAPFHLALLFVTGLVCHGELANGRPSPQHLTRFYLCVAVGGMLGGVVNALVAPAIFESVLEYPLIVAIACTMRPRSEPPRRRTSITADLTIAAVATLLMAAVYARSGSGTALLPASSRALILGLAVASSVLVAVACYRLAREPLRLSLAIGMVVVAAMVLDATRPGVLLRERNFFGVLEARFNASDSTHVLMHGTTKHGAQSLRPSRRSAALSYYEAHGPVGDVFRTRSRAALGRVAVVGLGTGALAAYGKRDQDWTFYEIDPAVVRIARNPAYFTYVLDTPATVHIVEGDARLRLAEAAEHGYDLIVLDAFSSDAIPVHLLTVQALRMYEGKLAPGGVLAVHLSNRYLDLEPVVARLADAADLVGLIRVNRGSARELRDFGGDQSIWAVLARNPDHLGGLWECAGWRQLEARAGVGLWTDDYSNIFSVVRAWAPARTRKAGLRDGGRVPVPC